METSNEITIKDILDTRDVLKRLSSKWAKLLAKKMYPDEEETTSRERVYNIINGSVRSPDIRSLFIDCAKDLKKELDQKIATTKENLNSIIE